MSKPRNFSSGSLFKSPVAPTASRFKQITVFEKYPQIQLTLVVLPPAGRFFEKLPYFEKIIPLIRLGT